MSMDDLYLQQCDLGLQLLGEWFLHPEREWPAVPIEWFLTPQLQSIAKEANLGVERNMLAYALFRNGGRKLWQAPSDIEQFLVEHPLSGDPLTLRNRLETVHQARELRDRAAVALAKVSSQPVEVTRAALLELSRAPIAKGFASISMAELFEPLGAEPWLCEALALQPGAPWMLSGHSSRGKSWLLTDLALAIASGQTFGGLKVRAGKVRWMHLEGSARDLKKRVQMLALGRQLGPQDIGGFVACVHPFFRFTDRSLEERLAAECVGFALCVVDTFAAAAAGMSENDASIREPLDMLARVSERTGCAFVVVHHHRKDPNDPRQKVDLEMAMRGSSALANALSASWSITRLKKKGPETLFRSKLSLGKTWYGDRDAIIVTATHSPFVAGAVDVTIVRAGVQDEESTAPVEEDHTELDNRIIDAVTARPGYYTKATLAETLRVRRGLLWERVGRWLEMGRLDLQNSKLGRARLYPGPLGSCSQSNPGTPPEQEHGPSVPEAP